MKLSVLFITLASLVQSLLAQTSETSPAKRDELRHLGSLPDDRKYELPKKGDRNPFADRAKQSKPEIADGDSEEARLRKKLQDTKITGIIAGAGGTGLKVMFGNQLLAEGDKLRWLLKDQTSELRVSKLTDKLIEFAWIENDPSVAIRKQPRSFGVGTAAIREQIAPDIMVKKNTNGEILKDHVVTPKEVLEAANLEKEAALTPTSRPSALAKQPN